MLRLIIASLLFLLSLLCIRRAPEFHLWYLAIIVTEFSIITIPLSSLVLLWGLKVERFQWAGTVVAGAALLLFMYPIFSAISVARALPEQMQQVFGKSPDSSSVAYADAPFTILKLLPHKTEQPIPFTEYEYSKEGMKLDFYPAQQSGKKPCVIVIHGGSWSGGDSRQLPELNTVMARAGYHVASINYRLAPAFHAPVPVDDVQAAIAYLKQHADKLAIDTNNFVLLGRSAGAQIALSAAYLQPISGVKGVISFYGPADMIWGYHNPASPLVMNSCKIIADYFGGTYDEQTERYKNGSPCALVNEHCVPTLMICGKNDPLVAYEHNIRLIEELRKYNIKYFLVTLPWATHGCDYTLNGPGGQLSTYAVMQFLKTTFQ